MLIETLGAAHDLGRLKEILGVMVRHGFGDTVRRLGLADKLERAGQALHWNLAGDLTRIEPPVQVRLALEELGPTFVKFCLLYTSPSPRDKRQSRMPSSA